MAEFFRMLMELHARCAARKRMSADARVIDGSYCEDGSESL